MFRLLTPIIRSSYNCNYSFWYWLTGSTTVRSRCWVGSDSCVSYDTQRRAVCSLEKWSFVALRIMLQKTQCVGQIQSVWVPSQAVGSSWNVMTHGDAREGKWRGNWRMERVASTVHTTSEHGVSSITTADAQTSAARSRLYWHPRRFKWTRPFRRKTRSGFCACAITFQTQSTLACHIVQQHTSVLAEWSMYCSNVYKML